MAGDWIKVEKSTARKPEVLVIAGKLGIHPDHAFGVCFRFWAWADDHLSDGHARSVTFVTVDSLLGHAGFAEAAASVGWLAETDDGIEIPNFDRHLSKSSKTRALATERKKKSRSESDSRHEEAVTKKAEKRDQRREEKSIPKGIQENPFKGHDELARAWDLWEQNRRDLKKPIGPTARNLQIKKIKTLPVARAIAMLNYSTENGYQGLHEPSTARGLQKNGGHDRNAGNANGNTDPSDFAFVD